MRINGCGPQIMSCQYCYSCCYRQPCRSGGRPRVPRLQAPTGSPLREAAMGGRGELSTRSPPALPLWRRSSWVAAAGGNGLPAAWRGNKQKHGLLARDPLAHWTQGTWLYTGGHGWKKRHHHHHPPTHAQGQITGTARKVLFARRVSGSVGSESSFRSLLEEHPSKT